MQKRINSLIRVKDWHIIPYWARGLAIGAIIGCILIIFFSFSFKNLNSETLLFIPPTLLIICIIIGLIVGERYKKFAHKKINLISLLKN